MRRMLVPAVAVAVLVGAQGAVAQSSSDGCTAAPLGQEELAAGAEAVRRYRANRERQFAPDLMGYRDGPRLGPPSRRERRRIRDSISLRRLFALNTNRLLIRRLLRDHKHTDYELGVPLAPLETRAMRFRDKAADALGPVDEYLATCASDASGDLYLTDRVPEGVVIVVNVTANPAQHLEALRARYRYADLLEMRVVRYTRAYLEEVRERISDDWEKLEKLGLNLSSLATDVSKNRVEVTLLNPSARARRILAERYGDAVWMDPRPTRFCTLVGCGSGVLVRLTRIPAEARTARVCAAGRCSESRIYRRHPRYNFAFAEVRCKSPRNKLVEVTVELLTASGARLRFSSAFVRLSHRNQPNGEGCAPICWNAGLRYRGDTGAIVEVTD